MSHPLSGYKTFLFSYHYDGSEWELPITARTLEEARARLARLGYATFKGEIMMTIPVSSKSGSFFGRLFESFRNILHPTGQ